MIATAAGSRNGPGGPSITASSLFAIDAASRCGQLPERKLYTRPCLTATTSRARLGYRTIDAVFRARPGDPGQWHGVCYSGSAR